MESATTTASLLAPVRPAFRALAVTIVPAAQALDEAGWRELEQIVEHALESRPAEQRRQLVSLIRLLDAAPLVLYGRRFRHLDDQRRARLLARVEDAPVKLLRRGFWGLRTLVLMGYYARADVARAIGYRADARGWEART